MGDYHHIKCSVMLVCVDALHPDQITRMRERENSLGPLSEAKIDEILASWKEKMMREIGKHDGYVVFGWDA